MSDVDVFYSALEGAARLIDEATMTLTPEAMDLAGEDTGIDNPAQRTALRLELHRRLTALQATAFSRLEKAGDLSAALQAIAHRYNELDTELSGAAP